MRVAEVSVTHAQILTLHTTPITIIEAPADGKFIQVISAVLVNDWTANYTATSPILALEYAVGVASVATVSDSDTFVASTGDLAIKLSITGTLGTKSEINALPVLLTNTGGAFSDGNAANVWRVRLTYVIIDAGW